MSRPLSPIQASAGAAKRSWPRRLALVSTAVVAALAVTGCGAAAGPGSPLAVGSSGRQAGDAPVAGALAEALEQGNWTTAAELLRRSPPPQSVAEWQIHAVVRWQTGPAAPALAAEDKLIAALGGKDSAAARSALLALARHHERTRKLGKPAARLLTAALTPGSDQPLQGCQDATTCALARRTAVLLAKEAAESAQQVLAWAPANPVVAARWITDTCEAIAATGELATARRWLDVAIAASGTASPSVDAAGRVTALEAEQLLWHGAYKLAVKAPTGTGRAQWLEQIRGNPESPARVSTQTLFALALHPDLAVQAPLAAQLLETVLARPDAPAQASLYYLQALGRAEDAAGLKAWLAQPGKTPTDAAGTAVAARWWLALRQPAEAEPYLQMLERLAPGDAVTLGLRAGALLTSGKKADADVLIAKMADAPGDRSLGHLILAQLGRKQRWDKTARALRKAAELPGAGQRMAARELATEDFRAQPASAAIVAVDQYARLLLQETPGPGPLSGDVDPSVHVARRQLFDSLVLPTWAEPRAAIVRLWSDAGLADPEMLRDLARRSVQEGDLAGFLRRERAATAEAAKQARELPTRDLLDDLLTARRGGPWLAHWLQLRQQLGPKWLDFPELDQDAQGWQAAGALLGSSFGLVGRALAWRQWRESAPRDLPAGVLGQMANHGAADLALRWLERLGPDQRDGIYLQQELSSRLVTGDIAGAETRLLQIGAKPGQTARMQRQLVDVAADNGLCKVVELVGAKLVGDADGYAHRVAVQRMLDCARQHGSESEARQVTTAVLAANPEPARVELLGRALSERGFDQLAVEVLQAERAKRPLGEDGLGAWARSLLALGRQSEAVPLLHQMVQVRRTSRVMTQAAEILEDHGLLDLADAFYSQALGMEPDARLLRARRIGLQLRLRAGHTVAEQLQELASRGATADDWRVVREMAARTGQQQLVLAALAGVTDADRDVERLRLHLAAELGDRDAALGGLRRLRSRSTVLGSEIVRQLMQLGQWRMAREVAEDDLASAEPTGGGVIRRDGFAAAIDTQRDPRSADETIRLARLYLGRALDPELVAPFAAMELGLRGLAKEAAAVSKLAPRDRDARFAVLRGGYAWDSGQAEEAMRIWRDARAQILLDPRLPDLLRSWDGRPNGRHEELSDSLTLLLAELVDAKQWPLITQWLHELVSLVPDARWPHQRLVFVHLLAGEPDQAADVLLQAMQRLPELGPGFAELADRVAQDGAAERLRAGLVAEGLWLRTEPWVATLMAGLQAQTGKVVAKDGKDNTADSVGLSVLALPAWRGLGAMHPGLRQSLAIALADRGRAAEAVTLLGPTALCGATGRTTDALRSAVAVLAGLQAGQADQTEPAVTAEAQRTMRQWLQCAFGPETALALAEQAVQQGHPALAAWLLREYPTHRGLSTESEDRRALVSVVALDEDDAVAALLQWLTGRRSQIDFPASDSAWAPADQALQWALLAGRPEVAQKLAAALRPTEPGLALPLPLLEDEPDLRTRVTAGDPTVVPAVVAATTTLPLTVLTAALPLVVATSPDNAWVVAARMAEQSDEPWRVWHNLYQLATSLEEPALASKALAQMTTARAPAGVLACAELAFVGGDLQSCMGGRDLRGLTDQDRLDLAQAVGRGLTEADESALRTLVVQAPTTTQLAMLQALAVRFVLASAQGRERQRAFAAAVLQAQPNAAVRGTLAAAALDDLAVLGLVQDAVQWTEAQRQRLPHGQGSRNNAAYALFLAGRAGEALALAKPSAWATSGDRAHAALDTLAASLFATGDAEQAVAVQMRALGAALVRPTTVGARTPQRQMALPMARLAGFLLAAGAHDQARKVAATAMQAEDDLTAMQAARRVWKQACRAAVSPSR